MNHHRRIDSHPGGQGLGVLRDDSETESDADEISDGFEARIGSRYSLRPQQQRRDGENPDGYAAVRGEEDEWASSGSHGIANVGTRATVTAWKEGHSDKPTAPLNSDTDHVPTSPLRGTRYQCGSDGSRVQEPDPHVMTKSNMSDQYDRGASVTVESEKSSNSLLRVPTFHASGQGPWHSVIAYDACVRLCLHSWARGCMEAPIFLENECALLRNSFGLQHILLQSEEELLGNPSSELTSNGNTPKARKTIGKMKVQVRKVRMTTDMPSRCSVLSLKQPVAGMDNLKNHLSNLRSVLSSGWRSVRKARVVPRLPVNNFSRHSMTFIHAGTQYIKHVSELLKIGVTNLRNSSSYEVMQEAYFCHLRLRSLTEEEGVRTQPGTGQTHVFFTDSTGDDLVIEVNDFKGNTCGRAVAQLASIMENATKKLRWWYIYNETRHELVGRIQLHVNYTACTDENSSFKSVVETIAYDIVLEVAMKVQHIRQRNLLLHGPWKWLLTEFASYYGVPTAYTNLRYLSYVMDVATPTSDCLMLIYDFLFPVILKSRSKNPLSHQENRILGEVEEKIEQILDLVFENYKSLDESSPSGMLEVLQPSDGSPGLALAPAVKIYALLHDILSPESQLKLCGYFQEAAKKILRRHLLETDEFVLNNTGQTLSDVTLSTAYRKLTSLCFNVRNEVCTDIEIHNQHVLPSFLDLPNICASIYSSELSRRLNAFLFACPPAGLSPRVADLLIAAADFQKDLASWNICPVKGGLDAKELFHVYIILWIQDRRRQLLEYCKLDKVNWSGSREQTSPFVEDIYDRLNATLNEYEVIMCRWPDYTFALENAIVDIEKGVIEALEKQHADVLISLKGSMVAKKFGLKYVQKLTKLNSVSSYAVPDELGVLLNTLKRLLDVLRPQVEVRLKSWSSCIPNGGNVVAGERLGEVTVMLRAKFRKYQQAVVEKLSENTRAQGSTRLKKIIQDSKDVLMESDIRKRMQPLKDHLAETINHLHTVFEGHVFMLLCRGFWDRMGQDVLSFLEDQKENRSWYRAARVTVSILDESFASQLQELHGNALQEKDLEPPSSIMELRSMLCNDSPVLKDSNLY